MLAMLALENGHIIYGRSIGITGIRVGEVVFNTALTGYQEILTDPSYAQQIITFTYPHIGNTGINAEDYQSKQIYAAGLIVRSLSKYYSNWRAKISLAEFLQQQQIVGIEGVDTRGLTKVLRTSGSTGPLRGCIMSGIIDTEYAISQARSFAGVNNHDLTSHVSSQERYTVPSKKSGVAQKLVLVDFGVKQGIIDSLTALGCDVIVVPAQTTAAEILYLQPDGIVLSNGPGDPAACQPIIHNIKDLISTNIPIFGICLGHQLLAIALGAKTYKMRFGHHGSNHPVKDLQHNTVMITSQNHGFAVDELSFDENVAVTHRSLFDGTVQGFRHKELALFGFQGHPEASPGPHDAFGLFVDFIHEVRNSNVKAFRFA